MSAQATQTTPQHDPGPQATNTSHHCQVLNDLVDMGAGLARLLYTQATAQAAHQPAPAAPQPGTHPDPQPTDAPPAPPPNALATLAHAFDQTARGVRRSIALARILAQPARPTTDPTQTRTAARKRILRAVEDTIHRAHNQGDAAERLNAELRERLDAPDLDDDIRSRPIAEIINDISRDLGLLSLPGDHAWPRRTPADLAQLHARAAAPTRAPQPGPTPDPIHRPAHQTQTPQPNDPATKPTAQPTPINPGPIHPNSALSNPAASVATLPRHPTPPRWRPPPSG